MLLQISLLKEFIQERFKQIFIANQYYRLENEDRMKMKRIAKEIIQEYLDINNFNNQYNVECGVLIGDIFCDIAVYDKQQMMISSSPYYVIIDIITYFYTDKIPKTNKLREYIQRKYPKLIVDRFKVPFLGKDTPNFYDFDYSAKRFKPNNVMNY